MNPKNPNILEQFRSFYYQNRPENLEVALEFFAIFGGLGWEVDTKKPAFEAVEAVILKNYKPLRNIISDITLGDVVSHALLTGAAMGDRRTHSALKRARISAKEGFPALHALEDAGLIHLEDSALRPPEQTDEKRVSPKVYFKRPFYQFWFAFISPLFKGISSGDYTEVKERFANRRQELSSVVFQKLSLELLKKSFTEDTFVKMGSYWDQDNEIDIIARTKSGKVIAGRCKSSSAKMKKSELNELKDSCEKAKIRADIIVLFSKNGFSNELKASKSETLRLFTLKNFKLLLEDIEAKEMIEGLKKEVYEG
jgi:hypothetical protein